MLPRLPIECRVVADPELRFSNSGTAVCKMRVVAADRRQNQSGEWEDGDTLWLDVTCFKKLAENVVESVVKGDLVIVYGKLKTEEWDDRETGAKRSKIVLLADSVGASLQFRVLPHAGETHRERAAARPEPGFQAPVTQAYGAGAEEPPF